MGYVFLGANKLSSCPIAISKDTNMGIQMKNRVTSQLSGWIHQEVGDLIMREGRETDCTGSLG